MQRGEIAVCSDQDIELGDNWHGHIQKHHRRDEELADAKQAILGQALR